MIGLDTNILVRYIAEDDGPQLQAVHRLMEHLGRHEDIGYVSTIAITETFWVLQSVHKLSISELTQAIETLLQIDSLHIQNKAEVHAAILAVRTVGADFADALIGAIGQWAGCSHTLTFDRKASRLPGMQLI